MKLFSLPIIIAFIALSSFTGVHKYYLSLTQINYVEEQETLQITTELFIDDFQKVLRKRYSPEVTLIKNKTSDSSKDFIFKYLKDKMTITINGETVDYQFLGIDYKEDKVVCYLEATDIPKISTFEVNNTLLLDMYPKQQNVVKLKSKNYEKSMLLIKGKERDRFEFSE